MTDWIKSMEKKHIVACKKANKNNIFSIQDAPENIYPHLVVVYDGRVVEVNQL